MHYGIQFGGINYLREHFFSILFKPTGIETLNAHIKLPPAFGDVGLSQS